MNRSNLICTATLGFLFALSASAAEQPGKAAKADAHPDFTGGWILKNPVKTLPDLRPSAMKTFAENKIGVEKKDPDVDTSLNCVPTGFPRGMISSTLPTLIVQSAQAMAIDGEVGGRPRVIYFKNKHADNYWPTWMGDSIGHWDGDTLVVETVNFIDKTFMGPQGLPHSDAMRVVERIRLIDGGATLEDKMVIEDPKVLKKPWSLTLDFGRKDDYRPVEHICETLHP